MSEYVSKEELKKFFESIEITVAGRKRAEAISEVLQAIYNGVMELPTTDAVPVIWCAECYFWDKEPSQTAMPEVHTCRYWRIGTTCIDYCGRASRDGWLKAIPRENKQCRD